MSVLRYCVDRLLCIFGRLAQDNDRSTGRIVKGGDYSAMISFNI